MSRSTGGTGRLVRYGFADAARAGSLLGYDGLARWAEVNGLAAVTSVGQLRRWYRHSLLAVVAADLTGAHDVEDTMAALSQLADATLSAALGLAVTEQRRDAPKCRLAILALGKS